MLDGRRRGSTPPASRTGSSSSPARAEAAGITAFVVERGTPGFTTREYRNKHGWRPSSVGELHFDRLPRAATRRCSASPATATASRSSSVGYGRLQVAARHCGGIRACLDESVAWANERELYGQPIARVPADPDQDRRHAARARHQPLPHLPLRAAARRGRDGPRGGLDGEGLHRRGADALRPRRGSDPGRARHRRGVARRAPVQGRQGVRDRRGRQRGAAHADRRVRAGIRTAARTGT